MQLRAFISTTEWPEMFKSAKRNLSLLEGN